MAAKPLYPVPPRTATIGMLLFLAALTMLFAASMVGYILTRLASNIRAPNELLHLPGVLWISTLVMIASSFTIARALAAVRNERHNALRANLIFTLALALTFVSIQAPAMVRVLRLHGEREPGGMALYGLVFCLILLHAVHVLGGLIGLVMVIIGAHRGRYDHEHHIPIRNIAWYWHFLDGVWLVMFLSMWVIG